MDIYVYNSNLERIGLIDVYQSLIWTKRYYQLGDFELYIHASTGLFEILQKDNILVREDDDSLMVIEHIEITTDVETGNYIIVSGRSIESYLSRRIVRYQINIDNTVENAIRQLIDENAINTKDNYRVIPNLTLGTAQGFADTLKMQITYDNLCDCVISLCQSYRYGFKIVLENNKLVFNLYQGVDHSYSQNTNPYVTFSPEFDNLINSHYVTNKQEYKNYAYVFGEGEGSKRSIRAVSLKAGHTPSGLDLHELYVDAKDLTTNDGEIGTREYGELLYTRGIEKLNESKETIAFEGEVNSNLSYQYKKDYNLGDIVQITNEYGITTKARITEIIESESDSGTELVPTFEYEEE